MSPPSTPAPCALRGDDLRRALQLGPVSDRLSRPADASPVSARTRVAAPRPSFQIASVAPDPRDPPSSAGPLTLRGSALEAALAAARRPQSD